MGDDLSTPAIVPRWEWRTFGVRLGAAEAVFAKLSPDSVEESDELYLLSAADGDTVKFRDDLMDVKQLRDVDGDGLEQWLPVLKASFPLPADVAASVLEGLHVSAPPPERDAYTLVELLEDLGQADAAVIPVDVHKRRQRYKAHGCAAELTDVRTERGSTRSIAVESEDPAAVTAAVRALGLERRRNTNYPRGLRSLVSFGESRYAVVDVGTNSVKFHLGERSADGAWRRVVDRSEVTRLGEGLAAGGDIRPEPMERTIDAIAAMADEAEEKGALQIAAVGTAGLRIASNANGFVTATRTRAGIDVEVISGEEEARLAFLAATSALDLPAGRLVVFDSGGGSSQFTFGHGGSVDERFSVDVGAVRFTEQFGLDGAVSVEGLVKAMDAISDALERLDGRPAPDGLVGMGGTITNVAAVKHGLETYDPDVVQGTVLDRAEIDRQIELFRVRSADERRSLPGLQPKRAEVILAGACIVRTVLELLGHESVTVSDRGLRHGLLVERFGTEGQDPTERERS